MRKMKITVIALLAMALLFTACGTNNNNDEPNGNDVNNEGAADVVTTASLVNDAEGFVNGVAEDGRWIVALLSDVTVDEDVVVAGTFYNQDDADGDVFRKLGLYAQDDDRNVTDNFTLTVPSLTIQSENLRIQGGVD